MVRDAEGADWRWVIDPLDGTVNYAHGFPCYCVSIGLEHEGQVVVGVKDAARQLGITRRALEYRVGRRAKGAGGAA